MSIALDPDNWQTGYLVDNNNQVWRFTNAGAAASDFTDITTNLNALGMTILKTVTLFPNTTVPNDEVVFVGGYGGTGVAATDNPTAGSTTQWTAFGAGQPTVPGSALPIVMVTGLVYDPTDNLLAASTYGRGFWEVKALSNFAGRAAPVVKLNDPGAAGNNFGTTYTAGGAPVAIASPNLSLSDPSSTTLVQLTLTLTNPQDGNAEVLAANTTGTNIIALPFNPASGQLILRGTDTLANYQKVLATVTYANTATPPTNTARIVNIAATDGVASGQATSTIAITGGTNGPAATGGPAGAGGTATPVRANQPASIGTGIQVTDSSSATLVGATATVMNLLDAPNEILAVDTTGTAISASYDPGTGVLTLSGTDTLANYQAVLDSLTYENAAVVPTLEPRTIRITLDDGTQKSLADAVTVQIQPINHAPTLNGSAVFTVNPLGQGETDNPGTTIDDLLLSAVPGNAISDPDPGETFGIAVVGVDDRKGTWQFTTDGGQTWDDFTDVAPARAVLLTNDADTLVRFVPAAGFAGTIADGLQFRAWDETSPVPQAAAVSPDSDGSIADTTQNGGSTPFSTAIAQAGITVNPVNQPPSFTLAATTLGVLASAGPQSIPAWARTIVAGGPGGLGGPGTSVTFQVSNNNNGFFSASRPSLLTAR